MFKSLLGHLAGFGIEILSYESLSLSEKTVLRHTYFANVFPLITPLAIDPAHPFPFVSNLSLNLLVSLRGIPRPAQSAAKAPHRSCRCFA